MDGQLERLYPAFGINGDDSMKRVYPSIPNEAVEDAANALTRRMMEQNRVETCHGHAHFFMLESGHSLITHFIPKKYWNVRNLERMKREVNKWFSSEIAGIKKAEGV